MKTFIISAFFSLMFCASNFSQLPKKSFTQPPEKPNNFFRILVKGSEKTITLVPSSNTIVQKTDEQKSKQVFEIEFQVNGTCSFKPEFGGFENALEVVYDGEETNRDSYGNPIKKYKIIQSKFSNKSSQFFTLEGRTSTDQYGRTTTDTYDKPTDENTAFFIRTSNGKYLSVEGGQKNTTNGARIIVSSKRQAFMLAPSAGSTNEVETDEDDN